MKIKAFCTATVFAFVAISWLPAQSAFKAELDGAQSGTNSMATGSANLILNASMDALSMEILFDGLTTAEITAFHIHVGMVGQMVV